ncbi:hypothetical protein OAK38_04845 [Verrucomicrobia bacterium]|jgi:hypothetical protein|nr:hypothetical protein [Verrucomicrobiota bacterium]
MDKNKYNLLIIAILCLVAGCAGTISSVNKNQSLFYEMSEEQADKLVASAMASEFAGSISRVEFPNKGYQATIRFAIDTHTIVAYFIPASGGGKKGFVFEVNHSGTMPISGSSRARSTYNKIIDRAALQFKPGTVTGYGN